MLQKTEDREKVSSKMAAGEPMDLENRSQKNKHKKLNHWVSFTAQPLSEENLDELATINELLKQVGVSVTITRNENAATGFSYDFLVLKVNKEQFTHAKKRGAGRKANFDAKHEKYGKCTVTELRELLQSRKKTEIAEKLGCSRMTLYRIVKNIEARNPEADTSIWHYTS